MFEQGTGAQARARLSRELEGTLIRILQRGRERTGARYGALGILDSGRMQLEHFLAVGVDERVRRAIGAPPRGRGVLGRLIADPRPLRLDSVTADARSYGFPPGHPVMHSFLGVPVMIGGEPWGNLYFAEKETGTFDEADEQEAVRLARHVSIAVANTRSTPLRPGG